MKYRDIIGMPKKKAKKKMIPTQPEYSVADNLKEEFGILNEWSEVDTGTKRWSKPFNSNMTEFEKKEMNEGPAYEYADQISKIDKLYDVYWDAVKDLGRTLEKKGLRKEAKQLYLTYRKQVSKFSQWFSKFSGGLM